MKGMEQKSESTSSSSTRDELLSLKSLKTPIQGILHTPALGKILDNKTVIGLVQQPCKKHDAFYHTHMFQQYKAYTTIYSYMTQRKYAHFYAKFNMNPSHVLKPLLTFDEFHTEFCGKDLSYRNAFLNSTWISFDNKRVSFSEFMLTVTKKPFETVLKRYLQRVEQARTQYQRQAEFCMFIMESNESKMQTKVSEINNDKANVCYMQVFSLMHLAAGMHNSKFMIPVEIMQGHAPDPEEPLHHYKAKQENKLTTADKVFVHYNPVLAEDFVRVDDVALANETMTKRMHLDPQIALQGAKKSQLVLQYTPCVNRGLCAAVYTVIEDSQIYFKLQRRPRIRAGIKGDKVGLKPKQDESVDVKSNFAFESNC